MIERLKQHKLILIIFIIGIILIVTGTTYSFYKIKLEGQKQHIVSSDVISFTYKESEDKISITNMNPISDTKGKKNNYFEFKVSSKLKENMNIKYIVSLSKIDIENSFEDNDIKMYLTDGNDNELISPTIISLLEENKKIKDSKIIYANTFAYNEQEQTHTYRIRIWLKENVDMSKYTKVVETETGTNVSLEQKTYKFKINVNTIESIDTSGANTPVLASNMIPVYYYGSTVKKADVNNFYSVETYKLGDINGNGTINSTDILLINRYINGKPSLFDINTKLKEQIADVDGDGTITENDATLFRQYRAGSIQTFPAGEPLEERKGITSNKWYSYESSGENKGMWANAVTVTSDKLETYKNASVGTTISMDDITTMWVWIPRFNAVTPSNYNGGTKDNPGAIDVSFVKQNETAIDAFTFGTKQLSGFWYGKFEIGGTLASSCTNETCNVSNIVVKPNVSSIRSQTVSSFFFASRSMEQTGNSFGFVSSEVDTHMSKNNEWGAVAYLTQSIYGRCTNSTTCTEVYINNSSGYYTGRSGGAAGSTPINGTYTDQTSTTQCNTYGFYTYDDYLLNYNTNTKGNKVKGKGTGASTTGTIYGIYDMSGGSEEYVMGVFADTNGKPRSGYSSSYNSGFTGMLDDGTTYTGIAFPDSKYYNLYTGSSYTGHALTETKNWYSDYADFVVSDSPWFRRGGYFNSSASAGVFHVSRGTGDLINSYSSHPVISNE